MLLARFPARLPFIFLSDLFRSGLLLSGLLAATFLPSLAPRAQAQLPELDVLSEEEAKQFKIAERFSTVLEKNPRRGTALDRVHGHHVEFGSLDKFLSELKERVEKKPADGTGWMLLGLFESQRGDDANAVEAFRKAHEHRPEDALPSYYLGQSLLLIGQPDEAVQAFEAATKRSPKRSDILEIYRQLGRVHQRAQRTQEALDVWSRLESLFPDDPRVQEQIAVTLSEEGEYALALPRYERLAQLVKDDYRRVMFQIEAAELKIRENRRDEGLADFETMIGNLNPQSWLYRDVRRRIEDVFLKMGDQDGLVAYYEKWIDTHPEDVGGMARLAKFLASSARVPEAIAWMEKAIKLSPSHANLRKAFIDQLVDDGRYAEAAQQYALLVESAPGNQDFLRDWGRLVLKNKAVDLDQRKQEAARIWNKIIEDRPDDALTNAQVADLFRHADMNDQAIALYQKAIDISPSDPQYREYLGEYYHILKRPEDALNIWKAIAADDRHTAENVARLAEVYNSFGYLDQAVQHIAEACQLDPKDFGLHVKASDYHSRASKFQPALEFVEIATNLATNEEQRETVINQRIEIFQTGRTLGEEIEKLSTTLKDQEQPASQELYLLARYYEADRRWADALDTVEKVLSQDNKSIPALTTAARIAELSGDYGRAVEENKKLAEVDRRARGDHLMNVARLQVQLGHSDEALATGRDLIVSAPGNTDNYEFYAQLCFQLGETDQGLDALRKAVRINPNEPNLIMSLGSALSRQFRTDEAIEVYWQAFEKTDEIDDKTSLTMKLAELYLQINQYDRLVERFERDRRQESKRREMTICLAQAHHSSGDYGTARIELESLLSEDTRDTNLLQQLSKLSEEGSDLESAIEYQRRLVSIAPGHETEYRLAKLLESSGNRDAASDILVKLTRREENPARLLRSLDSLLRQGSYESVIAVTEPLLSEQKEDWELLYREGVAWASLEKFSAAQDRFNRLLAIRLPHEKLGIAAQEKYKQAQAKAKTNNLRGIQSRMPQHQSPFTMLGMASQVRRAVGLDNNNYYGGNRAQPVWTPDSFGVARMAAYAWQIKVEQDLQSTQSSDSSEEKQPYGEEIHQLAIQEGADRDSIFNWMYLEQVRGNYESIFQIAKQLAKEGGREEQQFFLTSLRTRGTDASSNQARQSNQKTPQQPPLSEEDVELMMACFEAVSKADESKDLAAAYGGQITYASNGQAYVNIGGSWIVIGGGRGSLGLGLVITELKLAGREEQATKLLEEEIAAADSTQRLTSVMNIVNEQEDYQRLPELFDRWVQAAQAEIAKQPKSAGSKSARNSNRNSQLARISHFLIRWMGRIGAEEENAEVLALLDQSLDLSIQEANKRRDLLAAQSRHARKRASQSTRQANFSLYYGKENIYTRLDYPSGNQYVDVTTLMLLRQAFEVVKRNDVTSDLTEHLRNRVAAATKASSADLLYEQLMLGYVLWWLEEKEEAVDLLTAAAEQLQDDPSYRLEIANLRIQLGDLDEALTIVDSIAPRDQKLVQQRETMALELSERLGDIPRARKAAERLFGLRLDNNTQLALVERMRRLGLVEMAEAVVARVHRRSGNQTSSLATLMTLYQSQGKADLAQQIAHTILRRSTSPLSTMANATRNPFRNNRGGDANRKQALQMLHQTGALKSITARLEEQLERSPSSEHLYAQLIEYYQASGEREKVQELLEQAVINQPDAVVMRYQLAKQLEQSGKHDESCDQYLEILKKKPAWIADDLYSIRRNFERAKRSRDLVNALEKINLKSLQHPYYIIDLVTGMLDGRSSSDDEAKEKDIELAISLFERAFEAFPQYRSQMISRIHSEKLWTNDRIYQLGKKGAIPSKLEANAQPWFGLNNISSYGSGGKVSSMFHRLLGGVVGSEKEKDLRQAIENRLSESPNWHAGRAMLALIDLKNNEKEKAIQQLQELFADEEVVATMPSHSSWIIGQELDASEDTRALALRLYEQAIKNPQNQMNQMQYSPITRLVKLYSETGREADARSLMLKQLRGSNFNQNNQQYANYQKVENTTWVATQMLEMNFPVDSIRLYRTLIDNTAMVEQAGQWQGRPEYFTAKIRNGMDKALGALDESNADEAMKQLLTTIEQKRPGDPLLDLMLSTPDTKSLRKSNFNSQLVDLLDSISKDDEKIATAILSQFQALSVEHTNDLSVAIGHAAYLQNKKSENLGDTLTTLVAVVEDNPLEEVAAGRRPNTRQRRTALQSVSLWLIARECLADESKQEIGEKLATRALEGARRQVKNDHLVAILYDWGNLALEAGDRQQAEQCWSELLDLVTKRPETKPKSDNKKTTQLDSSSQFYATYTPSSKPSLWSAASPLLSLFGAVTADGEATENNTADRIPPLTLSQFRIAIEIALAAAENDMPQLSRRAVQSSLAGGLPIPDPPSTSNASSSSGVWSVSPTSRSGSNKPSATSEIEREVATTLHKVIQKWDNRDEYPAQEVYNLLYPMVLPSSRATEILMYADSSKLHDAKVSSLGATLVDWAQRADALEDLANRIQSRKKNPQSLIPALVLQTHIALTLADEELANAHLAELLSALEKQSHTPMLRLACHAALPATMHESSKENAYRILTKAIESQSPEEQNTDITLGKLAAMVNSHLTKNGDEVTVKKFFDAFIMRRQSHYARYSGDSGLNRQQSDWATIANNAAHTGVTSVALDFMGRVFDVYIPRYTRPNVKSAFVIVARDTSKLSASQRYKIWHDWTMPTKARQTIRIGAEWIEPTNIPTEFLQLDSSQQPPAPTELLSNLTELVTAATAADKLDELRQTAEQAYEQKIPGAEFLLPFVQLHQDDLTAAKPVVEKLVKSLKQRHGELAYGERVELWGDYLVFRACLSKSPESASWWDPGINDLLELIGENPSTGTIGYIQKDIALREASNLGATLKPGDNPQLKHWLPMYSEGQPQLGLHSWWAAHENHLVHLNGPNSDLLYFAYPLTGNFEFSLDTFMGDWAEGEAGYGGVVVKAHRYGSRASIWAVDKKENFYRPDGPERGRGKYDRITIQVSDGSVRHLINNHLLYEEKLSGTSPWLMLYADGQNTTTFRNFSLTGNPVIPNEVPLLSNNSMDGWNTSYFSERQPRHRLMAEKSDSNSSVSYQQQQEPNEFDWETTDGILFASPKPNSDAEDQSWAHYHRPLQEGETFRYQFFYTPGQTSAHPTIGRVALLLTPDGVKSHWICRAGWDDVIYGLPLDNELQPNDSSPNTIPLKPNDWNAVELSLHNDTVSVKLNDTHVHKQPLHSQTDRRFGLFRYKRQSLKVRQAVLTGNWPTEFSPELQNDLLAMNHKHSQADGQLINRITGESFFALDAGQIVEKAKQLPTEEAFNLLRHWVLPSENHTEARLHFQLPSRKNLTSRKNIDASHNRPHQLGCPAIEMLKLAKQLSQLDPLHQSIQAIETSNPQQLRSKTALLALTAIYQDDYPTTRQHLADLYQGLKKGLPKSLMPWQRTPEFVAAWEAAEYPILRAAAADMALTMQDLNLDKNQKKKHREFKQFVNTLVGRTNNLPQANHGLTQWQNVPYETRTTRALGHRPALWNHERGIVTHLPGETWSQLFFQSPLQGKFEIVAERTTHNDNKVFLAYGMHAVEPKEDLDGVHIYSGFHQPKSRNSDFKLPAWDELAEFRIAVDGSNITTHVNGVEIHKQKFRETPNPWVSLQASDPGNLATLRNLRILGTPEIPDEINLIETANTGGWRADIFTDDFAATNDNDNAAWSRVGNELRGSLPEDAQPKSPEGLLRYQRPMLENGEINFETFYVPGTFEVHPALGRFAYLIKPDGVKLHQITDAEWENGNLKPDNETPLDSLAEFSLKEKDWNQVRIVLQNDKLTLHINGTAVVEHTVAAPPTSRFFGLFRYITDTKCRVRNLVYRGDWPKQLPNLEQQQLAYPAEGPFLVDQESVQESLNLPLNRPVDQLQQDGISILGSDDGISTAENGLRLHAKQENDQKTQVGLTLDKSLSGDFEATLNFAELTLQSNQENGETGFSMLVAFDDPAKSVIELGMFIDHHGKHSVRTICQHQLPDGEPTQVDSQFSHTVTAGQLRILRRGNQLHCLLGDQENHFRLLKSYPVASSPTTKIELLGKTDGLANNFDVKLQQISIKTLKNSPTETKVSTLIRPRYQFSGRSRADTIKLPLATNQP